MILGWNAGLLTKIKGICSFGWSGGNSKGNPDSYRDQMTKNQ